VFDNLDLYYKRVFKVTEMIWTNESRSTNFNSRTSSFQFYFSSDYFIYFHRFEHTL